MKKVAIHPILLSVLIAYSVLQLYCSSRLSLSYDEGTFADYGATLLKGEVEKDVKKYDSKLPITALHMLPRALEQLLYPGLKKLNHDEDVRRGRWITLFITNVIALIIYSWSKRLYGKEAAVLAFLMFLLCPNILAHGILVSSDMFAVLFTLLTAFYAWKFCNEGKWQDFFLGSVSVGLGLVSKFSMIHLVIIFPLVIILYLTAQKKWSALVLKRGSLFIFFYGLVIWSILSAAHLFHGMFIPFSDYDFQSVPMQRIQELLSGLPVPVPSAYVRSLDAVLYYDSLGGGMPGSLNGATYLLDRQSVNGFWNYYFVCLWFKLPVSTLLLLLGALLFFILDTKDKKSSLLRNELFLLVPALYYLVYMSFFYSTQVGIRHILMIFPLIFIFSGTLLQYGRPLFLRYLSYGCLLFQVISVAAYFPHFLPYTNEWITDKKRAYNEIADTNICYGEGGLYLRSYLQKHPEAVYLPDTVRSGTIVMEVNEMLDLNIATQGKYSWARELDPVDHIHSQYLVFNVTPAMVDSINNRRK